MQKLLPSGQPLHPKKFQSFIFLWWNAHRRDLPWRHTHDPYKILVSEVMLQQTQVSRVIPKYIEFIRKYPTAKSLATATTADVIRIWKGLGYNRRALYLKQAAESGVFPASEHELKKLPGIGTYTARAVLVFAYKQDVSLIDTNIRQIITHFFFDDIQQKEDAIQKVADDLVPKGKSWEWHQTLMDYGALELKRVPGNIRKQKTFKNSNRYFRGKILDILRNGPVKKHVLLHDFSEQIIKGLQKDGLIEVKSAVVRLPD